MYFKNQIFASLFPALDILGAHSVDSSIPFIWWLVLFCLIFIFLNILNWCLKWEEGTGREQQKHWYERETSIGCMCPGHYQAAMFLHRMTSNHQLSHTDQSYLVLFLECFYCFDLLHAPVSSCIFPAPVLLSDVSPRTLVLKLRSGFPAN